MKIISGKYKGRNLLGFNIDGTRPTMDRVKTSLFAMIQNYIPDAIVLDLFAGSGALGIEALSEGAKQVVFVDNNIKAIKIINKNIENINIDNEDFLIIKNDYQRFLTSNDLTFDIIFLDPPYKTDYINEALMLIRDKELLNNRGIIVCETDNPKRINKLDYEVLNEKKYGDKYIVILKKV